MVFSCFAVYYRDNHARVVPYFESCMAPLAKQLKTIYYSLILFILLRKFLYTNAALRCFMNTLHLATNDTIFINRFADDSSTEKSIIVVKVSNKQNIIFNYFWNHHDNCIEMSTNMPRIGWVTCEIVNISNNISKFG